MTVNTVFKAGIDALIPAIEAIWEMPFIRNAENHNLALRVCCYIVEIRAGTYESAGQLLMEVDDLVDAVRRAGLTESDELFLLELKIDEARAAIRTGMMLR